MSARRSTAWAAEPGIATTPLPRLQVRWRQGGWEAYCPCCAAAVAHARDRLYATRAAEEHATRRCPQRLAVHGLRPCRGCDGWGLSTSAAVTSTAAMGPAHGPSAGRQSAAHE